MESKKRSLTQSEYDVHDLPINQEELVEFIEYWKRDGKSKSEYLTEEQKIDDRELLGRAKSAMIVLQQALLMQQVDPIQSKMHSAYRCALNVYVTRILNKIAKNSQDESVRTEAQESLNGYENIYIRKRSKLLKCANDSHI